MTHSRNTRASTRTRGAIRELATKETNRLEANTSCMAVARNTRGAVEGIDARRHRWRSGGRCG